MRRFDRDVVFRIASKITMPAMHSHTSAAKRGVICADKTHVSQKAVEKAS